MFNVNYLILRLLLNVIILRLLLNVKKTTLHERQRAEMGEAVFLMKAIVNRRIWEQKSTWILEKKNKKI